MSRIIFAGTTMHRAVLGALAAAMATFLASLSYQVFLSSLVADLLDAPLTFVVQLAIDPNLRALLARVLLHAITYGWLPYLLPPALVSGACLGVWLPLLPRSSRSAAAVLAIAGGASLVAAAAVSAIPVVRLVLFLLQERLPVRVAAKDTFFLHLGLLAPWSLLITCVLTARMTHTARRT